MADYASDEERRQAEREYQLRYKETHREELWEKNQRYWAEHRTEKKIYYETHRDEYRSRKQRTEDALRANTFRRYGNRCACCGTTDNLTIDHLNGGGNKHRAAIGLGARAAGIPFYRWLYRMYYPPGYQTLCRRCNTSKGKEKGSRCDLIHNPAPSLSS
jgi:hypothetical protein